MIWIILFFAVIAAVIAVAWMCGGDEPEIR